MSKRPSKPGPRKAIHNMTIDGSISYSRNSANSIQISPSEMNNDSDDSFSESDTTDNEQIVLTTRQKTSINQTSTYKNENKKNTLHKVPVKQPYNHPNCKPKSVKTANGNNIYYWIIGFIIILVATIVKYDVLSLLKSDNGESENLILSNVQNNIKNLRLKYKNQQKDLWSDVIMSIMNIIREPTKPSIIVLVGNNSDSLYCLTMLLGDVSSNALQSEGYLLLTPDTVKSDIGSVLTTLKPDIENKAVIVWDLLNINIEALKAFHNLCDKYNPFVKKVIYIITVVADDYGETTKPEKFVEEKLFNKLSGKMDANAIYPLISRITDGPILTVKPEPTVIDCPIQKL